MDALLWGKEQASCDSLDSMEESSDAFCQRELRETSSRGAAVYKADKADFVRISKSDHSASSSSGLPKYM